MKSPLHHSPTYPAYAWDWLKEASHASALALQTGLQEYWRQGVAALAGKSEPHVWMVRDRSGQFWWNGYDRSTHQRISDCSEADLRIWLETRYYQPSAKVKG